jgi:LCP family protein required for cell wall assembly
VRRRVVGIILALAAWAAGSAFGSTAGVRPAAATVPLLEIGRAHAGYAPVLTGKDPIFILVLGSDARPGTPVDRGLSDSIHIVALNPGRHRATILGFPRDSWVSIPGRGSGKINSAMPGGGPPLTIQTIEQLTGIEMDYYALTSFDGFSSLVDDLGGVVVDVPYPIDGYNRNFPEGKQRLSGSEALGLARTRKSLPRGDFDRSANQGVILLGALAQFRKEYAKDPGRLFDWLVASVRNVETDLSIDELMTLGFTASGIKPERVVNLVVPGTTGRVGTASVVFISEGAAGIYDDLRDDGIVKAPRGGG